MNNKVFYEKRFKSKLDKYVEESGNIEGSLDFFITFDLPKDSRILDLGANIGTFSHRLYEMGYKDTIGADISDQAIEYGKKKYPDLKDKLVSFSGDHLAFPNTSFDVVTMFDVIEHIPDVEKFLKGEVFRVLKPGGIFIFQTPNKYMNMVWTIMANKRWWGPEQRNEHCSLQTYWSLKDMLVNIGFKEVRIVKFGILTVYNITKVKKMVGWSGYVLLKIMAWMPIYVYTNLYGSTIKKE